MEGSVSNVEVCNFAYTGQLEKLRQSILSDKTLACKTDQDRRTALHWACSAGHTDIVEFLLDLGVEVNLEDDALWTPLHIAASAGREDIVRSLISKGAQLNSVNQNGCTPLHYAASKDRYEIALLLLENGADPNATDKYESTPLHRASTKGNYRLIQLLLKQSASTNIQDSQGNTPLHLACDEERVEAAKLLVEHGASIYIENKEEKTPLQMAKGGLGNILRRIAPASIMCDLTRDSNLETDNMADFSLMNSRLDSFHGSSLALQVPADKLARAGFFFTGHADRVCCFSCGKTVENWHSGDKPVERHKEVSPLCRFLCFAHRTRFNPSSDSTNGPIISDEAEDLGYQLRTGAVVDESTYPMAPHMRSEEARLQTFSSWPSAAPVRAQDLAQAGLYYLGESDRVQCFCCGGMLGGWEAGDTAWGEHTKHFPYCFFILGHDVGNIPFQGGTEEEECGSRNHHNTQGLMDSFEERLGSFAGVQHPIDHERLARAGLYSTGSRDGVLCFRCGGGLKGWQPEEDPWEEHAKHYPGCSFVLAEKGAEFVNSIQLQDPRRNRAVSFPCF
ncbi:putative E3 ubiquitin-protein ligase XIAP [Scophthalmus maximus]|uniref:26S proteasome non-ATPase regulatory subunit 10 n=1 Tax=Scophthalmus maximus TaxID=52904 RepID=A0A2U9CBX4_SCOMX|nr:putative E3 ubiquitin-protein ligase XIAP [Scophthalmus maximus]